MQGFANRIVAELENGVKPWVRPWDPDKAGGPQAPFNPVTGKRYHGINVLIPVPAATFGHSSSDGTGQSESHRMQNRILQPDTH